MKGLPPALKRKRRYIAFELVGEDTVDGREFLSALWNSMLSLFGEIGSAHCDIRLEMFDGRRGIVRCNRETLKKVKVALTLISRVGEIRVIPKILGVSGTIKKCRKKYLEVLRDASASDGI